MGNPRVQMVRINGASLTGIELLDVYKGRLDDRIELLSVTRNKETVCPSILLHGT
jgi:hypothetical protein